MKGYGSCMPPIDAGVVMDIEDLLIKFKLYKSLRQLSETILQTAATYMASHRGVATKNKELDDDFRGGRETTLDERIFGIYLTYALYYSQPKSCIVRIRMSVALNEDVVDFIDKLSQRVEFLEPVLCFKKLFDENAISVVVFEKVHDPATFKRHDLLDLTKQHYEDIESPLSKATAFLESSNLEVLNDIDKIYRKYRANLGMKNTTFSSASPMDMFKKTISNSRCLYESRVAEYLRTPCIDGTDKNMAAGTVQLHADLE
ncbi:hypothetical protein WR25_03096 [Diploscapter pachys]|uniref:Uncharacterized protein n=1 Tax=Diploscapter pachys TaxID=2018661 RepID=A0A2A2L5S1_9BILA|nr:hypothetical protein WR25_03096 [Diploscapter pachys]